MAAPPPAAPGPEFSPMVVALTTALAAAPFTTQADLAAAVAPLATQAQLAAMQAQMQAQFAAMQAQLLAQIQALLLSQNAHIVAMAVATARAVIAARSLNAHDRRGVPFAAVPRDDGTLPPNWPAGFNREALVEGPIGAIDAILGDYGLPQGAPATLFERRNALAAYIGSRADLGPIKGVRGEGMGSLGAERLRC